MKDLEEIAKKLGYKITDYHHNLSFVYGCRFYETDYKNVYITDYDMNNDISLKDKNQSMLFIPRKGSMIISNKILKDGKYLKLIFNEFLKKLETIE